MSNNPSFYPSKNVLAMDTSMGGVSVGVIAKNGFTVSRMEETERGQAAMLVPLIQEVIADAEIEFKDIELIATTVGPGSFTGLRIGLSTARTLGLALDIPVTGLGTLDVMAYHYAGAYAVEKSEKPLLVVIETKRQDFYARYYDVTGESPVPLSEPMTADSSVILKCAPKEGFVVGGDCLNRFQVSVSGDMVMLEQLSQPDPVLIARMGLEKFLKEGDQGAPQPLYLRGADVSQPKNPLRILEGFN